MDPIELVTERLVMRQISLQDRDFYLRINRLPQVMHYIDAVRDDAECDRRLAERVPLWQPSCGQWLTLVVRLRDSGEPIGLHGFRLEFAPQGPAELGYMFMPDSQGQGLAQEATRRVVQFAFDDCGVHKVSATVTGGNQASARLLEKLGFRLEGRLRAQFRLHDQWYDDLKYGLLADERQP
ncbi:GNAT family N-acetyltransferase [Paludibacterium sp. B53371]|uniref:GNAT family N-acetyltransferase n=1 Tax=Paludibacterium sp. B53371 TaxID=2806263 RepID=UPI001C049625|nr:GNAT family protein [Paludibacterium sp. B53371]